MTFQYCNFQKKAPDWDASSPEWYREAIGVSHQMFSLSYALTLSIRDPPAFSAHPLLRAPCSMLTWASHPYSSCLRPVMQGCGRSSSPVQVCVLTDESMRERDKTYMTPVVDPSPTCDHHHTPPTFSTPSNLDAPHTLTIRVAGLRP